MSYKDFIKSEAHFDMLDIQLYSIMISCNLCECMNELYDISYQVIHNFECAFGLPHLYLSTPMVYTRVFYDLINNDITSAGLNHRDLYCKVNPYERVCLKSWYHFDIRESFENEY